MSDPDPTHWMGCLVCGVSVYVRLADDKALIVCPTCGRQFVIQRQPFGGAVEVDGVPLPPFLGRRMSE